MSDVTLLLLFVLAILLLWLHIRESFSADTTNYANYVASLMNQGVPFSRVFSRASFEAVRNSKNPGALLTTLNDLQY